VPQVAVDDSPAVKIVGDDTGTLATGVALIRNAGTDEVYLGGSNVTSATGFQLAAATTLPPIPLSSGAEIYAICATGETATVHVLTIGA
jgi:hypothetical protein